MQNEKEKKTSLTISALCHFFFEININILNVLFQNESLDMSETYRESEDKKKIIDIS